MSGNVKRAIQDLKIRQCKNKHDKEVERQSDRYPQWILSEEPKKRGSCTLMSLSAIWRERAGTLTLLSGKN